MKLSKILAFTATAALAVGSIAGFAASAPASAVAASATAADVGFFAGLSGFVLGIVASWGIMILGLAVLFGILFEHNGRRGWSVFSMLLAAGVAYTVFNVPLMTLAVYGVGYFLVGLAWSVWRYKRHASDTVEKYRGRSDLERTRALERLHPKAMLPTITAWILIWPFSLIENLTSDIITAVQDLVSKVFRGIYHKIYNSAVAALAP